MRRAGLFPAVFALASFGRGTLAGEEGTGLAAQYPGDVGLGSDPAVILFYDYEHPSKWRTGWKGNMKLYAHTTDPKSVFAGRGALEATLRKGNTGNGGSYKLKRPETCVYQRVYVKFPQGYDIGSGMKFHGLAGTGPGKPDWYPQGSAGKRPDGTDKIYGIMCLGKRPGCYYYHPHQRGGYGDGGRFGSGFELGKWHCFEMMLKVNDVGEKNGELAFWLDGKSVKHVTGLAWRSSDKLALNLVLDHTYYNNGPPKDQSLFLDSRVVARKYIGPMVKRPPRAARASGESVWKLIAEKEKARQAGDESSGEAVKLAKAGDYAAAARAYEELALKGGDGAERFLALARALKRVNELREWIIDGVNAGREPKTYVDIMGVRMRGRAIAADERGLTVACMGNEIGLKWEAMPPAKLFSLARKFAAGDEQQGLLRALKQACGLGDG